MNMENWDDLPPEVQAAFAKHPEAFARIAGEPSAPATWFGSEGLRVAELSEFITGQTPVMHDQGFALWAYSGGVWQFDDGTFVKRRVNELLGNRCRVTHTGNVVHYLSTMSDRLQSDPVPEVINCTNGLLDWQTGELRGHSPDVLSTVQLPVEWKPDAVCPAVEVWLAEVLPADLLEPVDGGPGFVWELLGYLTFSGNPLHKAVLLLGSGRNGKGTFLRLVKALLGDGNVSAVTLEGLTTNRFAPALLFGKLANIAGDIDSAALKSTGQFKSLTGGDVVTADRKFGQPFTFTPWAVPVFSANAVFSSPDTSDGYMSRWVVVPFPNNFTGREDRFLDDRLQAPSELEGVLARAVVGLRALMERGNFPTTPSLEAAFTEFAAQSDQVRAFLSEVTVLDHDGYIERAKLWDVYKLWVQESAIKRGLGRNAFYTRCRSAGVDFVKTPGTYVSRGRRFVVRIDESSAYERRLEPVEGME